METGSGSEAASKAPIGSSDSLNGLTFGKKIYFEDVASGGNSSSSSFSSKAMEAASSAPPPPPQKKGKGVAHEGGGGGGGGKGQQQQQQQPPPRCQVEGCKVDLTGAKTYYCRHKVCGMHSKSPKVIVGGIEQRFCQQCSRFHQLHEFDQGKRSCRRRLAGHNERRRKPPPGPSSLRYGRLSSSLCEESGSRYPSLLMDFTYPRSSQHPSRDLWPIARASDRVPSVNQWQGDPSSQPCIHPSHQYTSEYHPSECYAGVSGSSCALSLLSNQAWDNAVVPRNRVPNLTTNVSGLDSTRMGEPMVVTCSCMVHPWAFKSHGAGGSTSNPEMQHEMGLGTHFHNGDGNGQFSSDLELALQGNGHCPDHGPVTASDHCGHGMHWSL